MGHIINPISYRLYSSRYWNNNWFTSNKLNYAFLANEDYKINKLVNRVFRYFLKSTKAGFMVPNIKTTRQFNKTSVYVYVHDCFADISITETHSFIKKHLKDVFNKTRRKMLKKNKRLLRNLVLEYYKILHVFVLSKGYWSDVKNILKVLLNRTGIRLQNMYVICVNKNYITSNMVGEFFSIRLKQRYTIWELLRGVNLLFKNLISKKAVVGYKIVCSGRFSRKQRATYSWKIFKSIAPASVKSRLDYNYRTVALKYSACTIKVFIRKRRNNLRIVEYIV